MGHTEFCRALIRKFGGNYNCNGLNTVLEDLRKIIIDPIWSK